jgi:hypothetical protein
MKIVYRLGSWLAYGVDCRVIGNIDKWQERLAEELKPMIEKAIPKCVCFSLAMD